MKRLIYGVAASALVLGMGGLAQACEQHAKSAALTNPFAAAHASVSQRGVVLAQTQQEGQDSATSEENKEKKPEAVSPSVGPLAQSQDDSAKEKTDEEKEKKPEMLPGRNRGMVLAQSQQDGQGGSSDEDNKAKSDDSK